MSNKVKQLVMSLTGTAMLVMFLILLLVSHSKALVNPETSWPRMVQTSFAVDPEAGIGQLVKAAGGAAQISISRATGLARFIRLRPGSLALPLSSQARPQEKAMAFFHAYGSAFGIVDPQAELFLDGIETDRLGMTRVAYRQVYQGVPVFGGILYIHFDKAGQLIAANGAFVPGIKVNARPALMSADAAGLAVNRVATQQAMAATKLRAHKSELTIFRSGLVQGVTGTSHLAYQVEVRDEAGAVREFVFIDAHTGQLLDQITGTHQALDRRVYLGGLDVASLVWKELDALPYTGPQATSINRMIDYAEDAYDLFFNISGNGYDSYDDQGGLMHSVYDDPGIGCPNALWNGVSTHYCSGVDGDDTVVHEWSHAYTEYTHNLIYQWQPGALNESYSDIFGEIADMINGAGLDSPGGNRTAGACSLFTPFVAGADNSYRWLSGEDDLGFGGAIRDMWTPGCYDDPGEVIDDNYACRSSDFGGVHTNSGVPNHAFALLVDGGNHNGVSVAQVGLTKTTAIYWRAMLVYQNPTTDFAAHADALEQSCADLIGQDIYDPVTGLVSAEPIQAADCVQVANAMLAVEMRQDAAAQCGFQPLLQNPPPPLCSSAISPSGRVYSATFESGVEGWTVSTEIVFSSVEPLTWALTDTLPAGRPGSAFFALNEQGGSCSSSNQDPEDDSRVMHLDSPLIPIPTNATYPRVSFWHWLATEEQYDGGNVKIRVNNGPWQLVEGQFYTFNAYNDSLETSAQGNTNPLASQDSFTGADGGQVLGSWGQSQVNVSAYAGPGDIIQLRFDFGSDGCTGLFGWYVDDVQVYYCQDKRLFMPVIRGD